MPHSHELERLNRTRWRLAAVLSAAMMFIYAGFILLIAYAPQRLAATIRPGMSIGILLGSAVIVAAWLLIGIYVRWTNRHYDGAMAAARGRE